jgi:hypothetical protein
MHIATKDINRRIAAEISWSRTANRSARTRPARQAFMNRFEKEVDPMASYRPMSADAEPNTPCAPKCSASPRGPLPLARLAELGLKQTLPNVCVTSRERLQYGYPHAGHCVTTQRLRVGTGLWPVAKTL